MPDGSAIPLPAPTMPDGLTAAAQEKAVAAAKPVGATLEQFTQKSSSAPVNVKVRTLKGQDGADYRAVDLWFVAHGDWDTLLSKKFGDSLTQKQAAKPAGGPDQPGVPAQVRLPDRSGNAETRLGRQGWQGRAGGPLLLHHLHPLRPRGNQRHAATRSSRAPRQHRAGHQGRPAVRQGRRISQRVAIRRARRPGQRWSSAPSSPIAGPAST